MSLARNALIFSATLVASLSIVDPTRAASAPDEVQFNRDIRPILSDKCFFCHGPDRNKRKADLRLDVEAEAKAERDGVIAVAPGNTEGSELVYRIFTDDADDVMPPPDSGKSLTPAQKETLKRWVEQGAKWEGHWAYVPPTKRDLPATKFDDRARVDFDRYIFAKLQSRNLTPVEEADRRTLIRRLSLDLIGLPPTPEEVEAFVNNESADAYEKLVDRLLASKHFGERMAAPWLDVVRYADTVGYHGDQMQNVFPYRDYVIDSFNSNKPFDQFTIEQLAGDLLDNPTTEQIVATGFNRLNMVTREGGAQDKEYMAKYGADRVRTVSTVWLGSTFSCAECHDHKFDPITTRDFYAMKAFFSDIKQWGVYADYGYTPNKDLRGFGNDHPFPPEIWVENAYLKNRMERKNEELSALVHSEFASTVTDDAGRTAFDAWKAGMSKFLSLHESGWAPVLVADVSSSKQTGAQILDDGSVLFSGKPENGDVLTLTTTPRDGVVAGLRIQAIPHENNQNKITRDGRGRFGLSLVAKVRRAGGEEERLNIYYGTADKHRARYSQGLPIQSIHGRWESDDDQVEEIHTAHYFIENPTEVGLGDQLIVELHSNEIGRVRISTSPLSPEVTEVYGSPEELAAAFSTAEPSGEQAQLLQRAWLTDRPGTGEFRKAYLALRQEVLECRDGKAPVQIVESREPDVVRVLPRGNWQDDSGEIVAPDTPDFLAKPETPAGRRMNRLDLARWIASTENPLTARVFANRVWKQFFGVGLSAVLDDLGNQGEWPVYPEVLDWLAVDFMESGWDVKHLVKTIALSDAYRRSSSPSAALVEADPYNKLLGRQTPRRLPAEIVRDNALAISGLLVEDVGGPSANPYQPPGYYEHLNFPGRTYQTSTDERQFRRGVYAHWQRTFLHPMMANFDAPSREECTADRTVSNTPQQALTLLNDPSFVEAARHFADRVVNETGGQSFGRRLRFAYEQALSRRPKPEERTSLRSFYDQQLEHYSENTDEAQKLLSVGISPSTSGDDLAEMAAWTSVCRVILNLHETVTRY